MSNTQSAWQEPLKDAFTAGWDGARAGDLFTGRWQVFIDSLASPATPPAAQSAAGKPVAREAIYRARRSVYEGYHNDRADLKNADLRVLLEQLDATLSASGADTEAQIVAWGDAAVEALWKPFFYNEEGWKTIVRMLLAKLPPLAGSAEGRFNQLIADLETWPEEDLELMRSTPEAKRLAAILTALAGQEDG